MTIKEWLKINFGITSLDVDTVSSFIGHPISDIIGVLSEDELQWLLVYDIVDNKKYKTCDNLSIPNKLFIRAIIDGIKRITNNIEITFDMEKEWVKYGN